MNTTFGKTLLGTTALVIALAAPAVAQDAASPYLPGVEQPVRASDFIGKRVYVTEADLTGAAGTAVATANTDWEDAGEISDLIISMSGDSEAALVDFGGFLGMGEKTVAVSMESLIMVPDADSPDDYFIVFQGSKATLEAAPEFDEKMVFATDSTAEPTASDMTATTGGVAPTMDGAMVDYSVMVDSDLIGKRVYGSNNEDVGEISAVTVDADNKITAAVVDVGGFLGMGEKPVALTSDMLRLVPDADGETIFRVTATQEQLEALPTYAK